MDSNRINAFRDKIILKSVSRKDFQELSRVNKLIGATELLLSTSIRSGVESFFLPVNAYLWDYALEGLRLFDAKICAIYFEKAVDNLKITKVKSSNYERLQNSIVIKEYETIQNGIENLIRKELNI